MIPRRAGRHGRRGRPGRRVVAVPVEEGRYRYLRPVKGGLVWLRSPVAGVLGEGGAGLDDDRPRPALQRFDLRKREVKELAGALDWFRVSGDGTRLVVRDHDELRVVPSARKHDDAGETVTVDLTRARFTGRPGRAVAARLRRGRAVHAPGLLDPGHVRGGLGRRARRRTGRCWTGSASAADFADLLWEVLGELGTSHAYVTAACERHAEPHPGGPARRGHLARRGRALAGGPGAAGRVVRPAGALAAGRAGRGGRPRRRAGRGGRAAGRPAPRSLAAAGRHGRQAGRADGPVRRPPPRPRRAVVVVPLRSDRRLRYQDWVAGRRRLVRELSDGRLGYLHIPDMMGEGWAHFHRDLRTEMARDGLIFDVRGNSGGHISELVVEKLARRVIGWGMGRWLRPGTYPREARRGPMVTVADEFAGSDGDIVTAAVKLLGLGPVVGTRTWGGVIGIEGCQGLVDGSAITVPRYAFFFDEYGWSVENYGVDPDVEVLITPDDAAAGRDTAAGDRGPARPGRAGQAAAAGPARGLRRPGQGPPPAAAPPRRPAGPSSDGPGRLDDRLIPLQAAQRAGSGRSRSCSASRSSVLAADAISKAQVLARLPGHPPVRLLHGLITLDLTFNAGAAFGVGTSYTAVIALIVCGVIVYIIRTARRLRSLAWTIALGLLLGGAMGNLGDRLFRAPGLFRGRVVDWINLPHFPWTFNLADASITCAAVLIAVLALRGVRIDGTTPAHAAARPDPDRLDPASSRPWPSRHRPDRRRPARRRPGSALPAGDRHRHAHADHGQAARPADQLEPARRAREPVPHRARREPPGAVGDRARSARTPGPAAASAPERRRRPRFTNCGRMAPNKMYDLGLVIPTTIPSRSARQPSRGSATAANASASDLRCRIAWMPSQARYAAPATLTTTKAAAERCRISPRPTETHAATT